MLDVSRVRSAADLCAIERTRLWADLRSRPLAHCCTEHVIRRLSPAGHNLFASCTFIHSPCSLFPRPWLSSECSVGGCTALVPRWPQRRQLCPRLMPTPHRQRWCNLHLVHSPLFHFSFLSSFTGSYKYRPVDIHLPSSLTRQSHAFTRVFARSPYRLLASPFTPHARAHTHVLAYPHTRSLTHSPSLCNALSHLFFNSHAHW